MTVRKSFVILINASAEKNEHERNAQYSDAM